MISGFNTDIEFNGTVYHIQTEDKGAPARMIVSLVYDRGTILASKRVSYDEIVALGLDEKGLSEQVGRQHKLICAAVRAGRIGELKGMTAKSAAASTRAKTVTRETTVPIAQMRSAPPKRDLANSPRTPLKIAIAEDERPIPTPPTALFANEVPLDKANATQIDEILPSDAVTVVSEFSGRERASNTKLSIELLGERNFKGGDRRTVSVMVCRGTERKVVANAEIMVKVVGSSFRPVIFHAASDSNGLAKVHLQLPHFQAGRAALLVRVITGSEEVELRRVVTPG